MQSIKIYCDESRQSGHRYKLIGSIWLAQDCCRAFADEFYSLCDREVGTRPVHMKWTKVPPSPDCKYMRFYTSIVDLYFAHNASHDMLFRTIVADPSYRFDHPTYHDGDFEQGFYKLYYELIVHMLRGDRRYHVRVAHRDPSLKVNRLSEGDRLRELHAALNNGFAKIMREAGGQLIGDRPVLSVEARRSQERLLIQLADILTGATGYHWNADHLTPGASKGKTYLAGYIARHLGRGDLRFESRRTDRKFNIFHLRPRGNAQQRAPYRLHRPP